MVSAGCADLQRSSFGGVFFNDESHFFELEKNGDPNGIRTRVTAVKGRCPNRWTIGSSEVGGEYGGMLPFLQALFHPFFGFAIDLSGCLLEKTSARADWTFFEICPDRLFAPF